MKMLSRDLSIHNYKDMTLHVIDKKGIYGFFVKDLCNILGVDDWVMFKARDEHLSKIEIAYYEYEDMDVPIVDIYGAHCFIFVSNHTNAEKFKLWLNDELMGKMRYMTFLKAEIFNDGQAHYLH